MIVVCTKLFSGFLQTTDIIGDGDGCEWQKYALQLENDDEWNCNQHYYNLDCIEMKYEYLHIYNVGYLKKCYKCILLYQTRRKQDVII